MSVYTSDILNGGTASCVSGPGSAVGNSVDNNESTDWYVIAALGTLWWKYDLSSSVTKKVRKLRMKAKDMFGGNYGILGFTLYGSNDNNNWTALYSGTQANNGNWQEYVFANNTAYRYYRIYFAGCYYRSDAVDVYEIEMMEEIEPPNTPSTPSGNSNVGVGISNQYSTAATDPAGRNVYYVFDWGDGSGYTSTGWYASGATGSASHAFAAPGSYSVRVYAVNSEGLGSGWSNILTVVVASGSSSFRLVGLC